MSKNYLTRVEAAAYLCECGLPISKNTLQKMACVGGGPLYSMFGNKSVYRPSDLIDWVTERLGKPRRSTSEKRAM